MLWAGCDNTPEGQIVESPVVPFTELFDHAHTIRLDPSIMMSGISTMDVNQAGSLLVGDGLGSRVHLFSSSGEYIRAYSMRKCLPDDSPKYDPSGVRFLGQDKVIVKTLAGQVAVLTIDGQCIKASRRLPRRTMGFCTSNDSIFFLEYRGQREIPYFNQLSQSTLLSFINWTKYLLKCQISGTECWSRYNHGKKY